MKYEKADRNRGLRLKFEDFILNYNETLKIVLEFIGINESKHVLKKQYFIKINQILKSKSSLFLSFFTLYS